MITFGQLHISVKSCSNKLSIMGKKKEKTFIPNKVCQKEKIQGLLKMGTLPFFIPVRQDLTFSESFCSLFFT